MRSKELTTFQNDISELNNRYSYFLFISEQFLLDSQLKLNSISAGKIKSLSTKDIFSFNKYSSQFSIPVGNLEYETLLTKEFILRSLFLLSYFQFEIYLKDIYSLVKSYKPELPEADHKSSMITQIKNNLVDLMKSFTQPDLDTIDYLRLLRNHLVHRAATSEAKKALKDFVNANGKALNKYWTESDLVIQSLDFTLKSERLGKFDNCDVIDILNILRRLSEKFDMFMLSQIEEKKIIERLIESFWQTYKEIKNTNTETIVKKFKHFAMIELGIEYNDKQAQSVLGVELGG